MVAKVKSGDVELETHWELTPSAKRPSYVRLTQNGRVIAYEQFAPPQKPTPTNKGMEK